MEGNIDTLTLQHADELGTGRLKDVAGRMQNRTLLFVDADNQAPALVRPLLRFIGNVGREVSGAIVAGNGSGDRLRAWEVALSDAVPDASIRSHVAPMRKQSADVRLMFELATLYHGQPDSSLLVVVVSRDDLLLAAAECLSALGHNVLIAVGASSPATPVITELSVVVLPSPQQSATAAATRPPTTSTVAQASTGVDPQTIAAAIKQIKQSLSPHQDGGYAASAVGQVLSQLGHDKATRTKIVSAIPNLRETGAGADKRLIF